MADILALLRLVVYESTEAMVQGLDVYINSHLAY